MRSRISQAGLPYPDALGLNAHAAVVGKWTADGSSYRPFLANPPVPAATANVPVAQSSGLLAIHNNGVAVGFIRDTTGTTRHALRYDGTAATSLNAALGASWAVAADINNDGVIVGTAIPDGKDNYSAFIDDPAHGSVVDVGVLPGLDSSEARAINDFGVVVGSCFESDGVAQRPFIYKPGAGLQELTGQTGSAVDVNSAGTVLAARQGFVSTGGNSGPFLWRGGTVESIPVNGIVYAVNRWDEVVGDSSDGAFIYRNGVVTLLNSLVDPSYQYNIVLAYDINDSAQISASALLPNESGAALLLSPQRLDASRLVTMIAEILFGVVQDGGGLVRLGKTPIPIGPWGPLTETQRRRVTDRVEAVVDQLLVSEAAQDETLREVRALLDLDG